MCLKLNWGRLVKSTLHTTQHTMGIDNSKPTDVSDAAWERVQNRKLDMIEQERQKRLVLEIKRYEGMQRLNTDLLQYCSACHDAPRFMMVFPSYRERCSVARGNLLNNVTNIVASSIDQQSADEFINQITKS